MAKLITQILHIINHINGIQNYGRLWFLRHQKNINFYRWTNDFLGRSSDLLRSVGTGPVLVRARINRTQINVIK